MEGGASAASRWLEDSYDESVSVNHRYWLSVVVVDDKDRPLYVDTGHWTVQCNKTRISWTLWSSSAHKLGEVKNECSLHKLLSWPSFYQKLSKLMEIWRSSDENNFDCFLRHGVLSVDGACLSLSLLLCCCMTPDKTIPDLFGPAFGILRMIGDWVFLELTESIPVILHGALWETIRHRNQWEVSELRDKYMLNINVSVIIIIIIISSSSNNNNNTKPVGDVLCLIRSLDVIGHMTIRLPLGTFL